MMVVSTLRALVPLLLVIPAPAMTIDLSATPTYSVTAGGYETSLAPLIPLRQGLSNNIITLFQQDYPGFSYANADAAASGTLAISALAAVQNTLAGGLYISASFTPTTGSHAPHAYEWMQYLTIDPLSTPFAGAVSSPFTDPPPNERDDNLPFYWTIPERNTPGLGYAAGTNINDDLLFTDAPLVNNLRSPVKVRLSLYLADFDSTNGSVTIYDGLQYGFDIAAATAVPEPDTGVWLPAAFLVLEVLKLSKRAARLRSGCRLSRQKRRICLEIFDFLRHNRP